MEMKRFGTFEGVFTPTVLSIIGVIMYLRLGWVVGNVGLSGALIIIAIANLITLFTGLAMSSIVTNIRVGSGGAYSIISKSLGLEVGGAIGMPLYLSQAISVAFYITGFTECWIFVFPGQNFILVSLAAWSVLLIISYASARLAFRLQYGIMAAILLSLISIFLAKGTLEQPHFFWQGLGQMNFWKVFAIFFPAVTGILAGASMSGELKDPKRSIPVGTLSAIIASFLIYVSVALWFARSAHPQDLVRNTSIIIELAKWRWLVVAGIMGATISSALSMFVASPRTLLALGKYRIIPLSSAFSRVNKRGEPATAILFTALLALITIAMGSLNQIAGLLTMFFLITYGMINFSVLIEQGIGIVSFRPTFKVSLIFPFLGGLGCFLAMFLINPGFSVIAIFIIIASYFLLLRRGLSENWPDVRKGFFVFIAEQATKAAARLPYHPKIWKPALLVPVGSPKDWVGMIGFLKAITFPGGSIAFCRIKEGKFVSEYSNRKDGFVLRKQFEEEISLIAKPISEEGILVSSIAVESPDLLTGVGILAQTLKGTFFPPNTLLMKLGATTEKDSLVTGMLKKAQLESLGIIVIGLHPKAGFGQEKTVNIWIRDKSPNIDLGILVALQLEKNWEGVLRLIQVVSDSAEQEKGQDYLERLKKLTRIPDDAEIQVMVGSFDAAISAPPQADINIFGIPAEPDVFWMRQVAEKINTSVLFLRDSGKESAIA